MWSCNNLFCSGWPFTFELKNPVQLTVNSMEKYGEEKFYHSLHRRNNGRDGVSNHQPHDCLLHRLLGRRSKKTSKLCVTGLCVGNSPVTGEFPTQRASKAENVSIWWRHHAHDFPVPVKHRFINQLSMYFNKRVDLEGQIPAAPLTHQNVNSGHGKNFEWLR